MKKIVNLLLVMGLLTTSSRSMEEDSNQLAKLESTHNEPISEDVPSEAALQLSLAQFKKVKKKRASKKSKQISTVESVPPTSKETSWADVPDEVLLLIMSYVGGSNCRQAIKQFKEIEVVSKKFQALVNDANMFPAGLQEFKNLYSIQAQTLTIKAKLSSAQRAQSKKKKNDEDYVAHVASQDDIVALKAYIADGGNVQERMQGLKLSPLILALGAGHGEAAELLINANALDCEESTRELLTATILGNTESAEALRDDGLPVEAADKKKRTALLYAAARGNEDLVRLLINRHADTNAADEQGCTPLMLAAYFGHKKIVEILIDNGAEINARTHKPDPTEDNSPRAATISLADRTVLMFAISGKHNEVVEILVSHGADVNARTELGMSVLAFATIFGSKEIVAYLIDHGASVKQASSVSHYIPLYIATIAGYSEIIELLISHGADVNAKMFPPADAHGQASDNTRFLTPLMLAAQFGFIEAAKILLDHGAEVNVKGAEGVTSLMLAAAFGYIPLADLLLQHGAQINETHKDNGNALTFAALGGHSKMIEFLVERGAQLAPEDKVAAVVLMKAAIEKNQELVELLLRIGVPINLDNQYALLRFAIETKNEAALEKAVTKENVNSKKDGVPLLHFAACHNKVEILEFLINKGADVNMTDELGRTALMAAARSGLREHVKLLIAKEADVSACTRGLLTTPLMDAARGGNPEVIKLLIEAEVDINDENKIGQTALMIAAERGNEDSVGVLLDNRASINAKDGKGKTALMYGAKNGHKNVVILLVKKGADIEVKDKHNKTAFAYAAQNGHTAIVEYILDIVADLNNEEIRIALEAALQKGHTKIGELLKKKIN